MTKKLIFFPFFRTKALVVELLSAICLVKDGHGLIMDAFNRFRVVIFGIFSFKKFFQDYKEGFRFQTLMHFFRHPSEFHLEFMSACMQFFNVLVHSVEDLNYRVFLQYEFTLVGLDDYLEVKNFLRRVNIAIWSKIIIPHSPVIRQKWSKNRQKSF